MFAGTFKRRLQALWAACLLLAVAPLALCAAADPEVLLSEDFAKMPQGLGEPTATLYVKDQALHVVVDEKTWRRFIFPTQMSDADASLRVRLPDFASKNNGEVGLAFWAESSDDFYALVVDDGGLYAVKHYVKGVFRQSALFRALVDFKPAPGDWVDLRVVTRHALTTVYVNGKEMTTIKGRPPTKGGKIGLYTYSGKTGHTAEFSALKVVAPTGPVPANAEPNPPNVLYAWDSTRVDPGWDGPSNDLSFRDGAFVFDVQPKHRAWRLFFGESAAGMSITAKVRVLTSVNDTAAVGLVLCAKNRSNLIACKVQANDWVEIYKVVNGEWKSLVGRSAFKDLKLNLHEWTDLTATATSENYNLTINGVGVVNYFREGEREDGKFGIYAEAGAASTQVEFKDIVAKRVFLPPKK